MLWLKRTPNLASCEPITFEKSSFQMKRSWWFVPRGLVPEVAVAARAPADGRDAGALDAREDGGEHGGDLIVERLAGRARRDEDVVAGASRTGTR